MNTLRLLTIAALTVLLGAPAAYAGLLDDLVKSIENSDNEQARVLLQKGLDVNSTDQQGNTLLMLAARTGNDELVDHLIKLRARVSSRNRYGDSALMLAAMGGHEKVVRRLLQAKAPIIHSGWTPLIYAAFQGHGGIVDMLVERGADLDAQAPNGMTALIAAARNGHKPAVRSLLEAGAGLNLRDSNGRTAVGWAKATGNTDIAEQLTGLGATD